MPVRSDEKLVHPISRSFLFLLKDVRYESSLSAPSLTCRYGVLPTICFELGMLVEGRTRAGIKRAFFLYEASPRSFEPETNDINTAETD